MQYADAVATLRRIPLFAPFDGASLKLLAFSSAYLTFDDGEVLCREGDAGDSVFIIDEGMVDVSVTMDGRRTPVATLGKHDLFGEMAVIARMPRSATVCAAGTVKVLKVEGDVFLELALGNADAALGVMRALVTKLVNITALYEQLKRALPETDPLFALTVAAVEDSPQ